MSEYFVWYILIINIYVSIHIQITIWCAFLMNYEQYLQFKSILWNILGST